MDVYGVSMGYLYSRTRIHQPFCWRVGVLDIANEILSHPKIDESGGANGLMHPQNT